MNTTAKEGLNDNTTAEMARCSFCHKTQDAVKHLISSPSDWPRAYICEECVVVCNSILWEKEKENT